MWGDPGYKEPTLGNIKLHLRKYGPHEIDAKFSLVAWIFFWFLDCHGKTFLEKKSWSKLSQVKYEIKIQSESKLSLAKYDIEITLLIQTISGQMEVKSVSGSEEFVAGVRTNTRDPACNLGCNANASKLFFLSSKIRYPPVGTWGRSAPP